MMLGIAIIISTREDTTQKRKQSSACKAVTLFFVFNHALPLHILMSREIINRSKKAPNTIYVSQSMQVTKQRFIKFAVSRETQLLFIS